MDVLHKALPEQFFLEASDECLSNLSKLIDVGVALCIEEYVRAPGANPAVVARIHETLDEAVKIATFHQALHNDGTVATLRNLNLDAISAMTSIQQMEALVATLDKVRTNRRYMKDTIKPRSRDDYEDFLKSAPVAYQRGISVNRDYFYDPKAKDAPTGLSSIIRKQQEMDIAYNGLKYRLYIFQHHRDNPTEYFAKV